MGFYKLRQMVFLSYFIFNCLNNITALPGFNGFEAISYQIEEIMVSDDFEKVIFHFPQGSPPPYDEFPIFMLFIEKNMVFIIEQNIIPYRDIFYIGEINNKVDHENEYDIYTINIIKTIGSKIVLNNTMQLRISEDNIQVIFQYDKSAFGEMILNIRHRNEIDFSNISIIRKVYLRKADN